MTLLISFLATIIGAFIGVYLKEVFSDIFYRKRRMREAKSSMIRNVVKFFKHMKNHANHYNGAEIHRHRLNWLRIRRKSPDLPQTMIDSLNADIDGLFEYGKGLAEKDEKIYITLVEIEAEITSLSVECSHYLEKHQYSQLKKSLDEMFLCAQTENIKVKGYESLGYHELLAFQDDGYIKQLRLIDNELDLNQKKYEALINEILS
jgi:hypothetical protein